MFHHHNIMGKDATQMEVNLMIKQIASYPVMMMVIDSIFIFPQKDKGECLPSNVTLVSHWHWHQCLYPHCVHDMSIICPKVFHQWLSNLAI